MQLIIAEQVALDKAMAYSLCHHCSPLLTKKIDSLSFELKLEQSTRTTYTVDGVRMSPTQWIDTLLRENITLQNSNSNLRTQIEVAKTFIPANRRAQFDSFEIRMQRP